MKRGWLVEWLHSLWYDRKVARRTLVQLLSGAMILWGIWETMPENRTFEERLPDALKVVIGLAVRELKDTPEPKEESEPTS